MTGDLRAVLDTGAVMAYAHGVDTVGEVLVQAADAKAEVWLPSTCLIEAYSLLDFDEFAVVGLLRANPVVVVVPPERVHNGDDFPAIGGMARRAGRLGAGHAAFLAMSRAAEVVTSRPDQIRAALLDNWPVIEVLTP
ncbi:MAG TPA: hypothetical protein VGF17_31140 [Phytomonospora sp.]